MDIFLLGVQYVKSMEKHNFDVVQCGMTSEGKYLCKIHNGCKIFVTLFSVALGNRHN